MIEECVFRDQRHRGHVMGPGARRSQQIPRPAVSNEQSGRVDLALEGCYDAVTSPASRSARVRGPT